MNDGFVEVVAPPLSPGEMHRFDVDGTVRLLVCIEAGLYALDGICTHEYAELEDGEVEDGILWCPLHAAGFQVTTGVVVCEPAPCALRTYAVENRDGRVFVSREPRPHPDLADDREREGEGR